MRKDYLFIIFFAILIFAINLILIYPYLFQSAPGWIESIEASFITIGRWWAQNFPHVFWNPYWYAGFPMRFSYVPLVPISTALLGSLIGDFGRAYHLIAGFAYALVPVSLFLFIRYLTKNTLAALVGALIFSLVPSQGNVFAHVRAAQGLFAQQYLPPWRMMVMVFYGEGPHTVAQVFLPLAGLFYLLALEKKKYRYTLLASLAIAGAALANPIGLWATGILLGSIFLIFLLWKEAAAEIIKRTVVIALLAYLFVSFWYTLGFIKSDLMAEGGGLFSGILQYFPWGLGFVLLVFGGLLSVMRKYVKSPLTALAIFWFVFTAFVVWIFYKYGIELAPQARRYIPEMDMAGATLAAILVARGSDYLKTKFHWGLGLVLPLSLVILISLLTVKTWSAAHWFNRHSNESETNFLERKMNSWLSEHVQEGERVFVSANYTFWLDFQTDIWQLRGGHWQASIHPWEPHAGYQITNGQDAETSFLWLKALAIKWLVVNKHGSPVHYADYTYPDKFMEFFQNPKYMFFPSNRDELDYYKSCYVSYPSEIVYGVTLVHGMAGPVALNRLTSLKKPRDGADREALRVYVSWIEESQSQVKFQRINNDLYQIEGSLKDGEGIRVAMAYDKGFRAKDERGESLRIVEDQLGFLVIEPQKPGLSKITLTYGPTFDFYLGWLVFAGGLLGAVKFRKRS